MAFCTALLARVREDCELTPVGVDVQSLKRVQVLVPGPLPRVTQYPPPESWVRFRSGLRRSVWGFALKDRHDLGKEARCLRDPPPGVSDRKKSGLHVRGNWGALHGGSGGADGSHDVEAE